MSSPLLSICHFLLPFFDTAAACTLRSVCRAFCGAVSQHPWLDRETVIQGDVGRWRACFPLARAANVRSLRRGLHAPPHRKAQVLDSDFEHLQGLQWLDMSGCRLVSDAAFAHLRGIQTLIMEGCRPGHNHQCSLLPPGWHTRAGH